MYVPVFTDEVTDKNERVCSLQIFAFGYILYCNDLCLLHVYSLFSLGQQQKGTEIARTDNEDSRMERATVSLLDRKEYNKGHL